MAFDKEILRQINNRFTARRLENEAQADSRREYIYDRIPRIKEIDRELRLTPIEIVRAAFSNREDAAPLLEKAKEKNLELQAERAELLAANGFNRDYTDVHCECKKCEDKGYINPGEPCECLLSEYKKEMVEKLRDTFGFQVRSFDSFKIDYHSKEATGNFPSPYDVMKLNLSLCKTYAEKFSRDSENLFITGGTGLGKTHLASAIALEVASKGYSVSYGTAFEILGAFEDKKFSRESDDTKTEEYKNAELLIIDDLGAEMITQFSIAALYNLMVTREAAGKSTIIISTYSVKDIGVKYTPQIASRIGGEYATISLMGEDIRDAKRK